MKRPRIGEILLEANVITEGQLEEALEEQKRFGGKLGEVFVRLGYAHESSILDAISVQLRVPRIQLDACSPPQEVILSVPSHVAKRHRMVPFSKEGSFLKVATDDPLNLDGVDEIAYITGAEVILHVCSDAEIDRALDRFYGPDDHITEAIEELKPAENEAQISISKRETERTHHDAPIIRLTNDLLNQALKERASDIHIEPDEVFCRIRFRIDGILHEAHRIPKELEAPLISRIKVMSNLDIAEKRAPQDGRIEIKTENREISVRVSTFPTIFGENMVLRLLDKSTALYKLNMLGLDEKDMRKLEELSQKPYGMILATGPTGSGKTTTLYAAISRINTMEKNIKTIEDPVEYRLPMVRQSQVNPKAGITFASGLRAILRQDPDVILVGEIRDHETAKISVQAALTGHLVFSTLHTNDAAGALVRLGDMGIEPYLIASTVIGIIAQRLVRKICENCKEEYTPSPAQMRNLRMSGLIPAEASRLYRGRGCNTCKNTGYYGRTGVFELLVVNNEIRDLIVEKAPVSEITKAAIESGMKPLKMDAVNKVTSGITTIEEALRVSMTE